MSAIQTSSGIPAAPESGWAAWAERRWVVAAVYVTLTAIALYPIFSVTVPPLVDYPNHLARMHIIANWANDPALQKNYVVDWKLHPNMAMDLIVPLLAKVMPIYMAGKIFIAMTMLSILGGTLALRKVVVGHVGLWPVLTFLLLYNHALFWGFLNYLFTAGLALGAFAGWIALRRWQMWLRIGVFSAVAFVLYVGHLFGLLVYGLLVFGYEVWRMRDRPMPIARNIRDWAGIGIQFAAPALLFFFWIAANGSTEGATTSFGTVADRFSMFISPVNIGLIRIDLPTLTFLAVIWLLCRSDTCIRFAPALKLPALIVTVAALLMPSYLSGVWGTHLRLPLVIGCLLIAGVEFTRARWRPMPFLLGAATILIVLRCVLVVQSWGDFDRKFAEFRQASETIGVGARLLPVEGEGVDLKGKSPLYHMQFWHMASLAVIERSVFLPTLFTGHTAVSSSNAMKHIDTPVGNPVSPKMLAMGENADTSIYRPGHRFERYMRAYWIDWPENFDYLLYLHFGSTEDIASARLQPLAGGTFFSISRVR